MFTIQTRDNKPSTSSFIFSVKGYTSSAQQLRISSPDSSYLNLLSTVEGVLVRQPGSRGTAVCGIQWVVSAPQPSASRINSSDCHPPRCVTVQSPICACRCSAVFIAQLPRLRASAPTLSGLLKMRPARDAKLTQPFCSPPPAGGIH